MRRLLERSRRPQIDGSELLIEPMRRRHLRQIMPIETVVYPKPWTIGVFHSELDGVRTGTRCYLVARRAGSVVGYGGMMYVVDEAHITNLAVAPSDQRRGVGRSVLTALARAAIARGAEHLSLEVRVSNQAAQELYRRFGFAPAGIRPRYYENVEDAIVMWCHDIATPAYAERLAGLEAGR